MRSRILVGLIAGAIGGFLGYMLQERLVNYNGSVLLGLSAEQTRTVAYAVGGFIGLLLGAIDGIVESNPGKLVRGMAAGAVAGALLGCAGFYVGNGLYVLLGGTSGLPQDSGALGFVRQVIARAFGWAILGVGVGAGSAIGTFSAKRIVRGAIGGLLGGFLGGLVFDLIAVGSTPLQASAGASGVYDTGGASRAVGFTAIGGLTGLFIGIVEELMKQAWVRVLAGRNEGKDYTLTKAISILGRDERSDVPLYSDMSIASQHAAIRCDGKRHVLIDAGTPSGTYVNGQRMQPSGELLLRDGDMIQIGSQRILFREKATASRLARPAVDAPGRTAAQSSVPMPSHLCPFCGAPKDAAGGCLCTVGAQASSPGLYGGTPAVALPSYGQFEAGYAPGANTGFTPDGAPTAVAPPAVSGAGVARLVALDGAIAGQVFSLNGANTTVGREAGCDIVLTGDTFASRNHASIVQESGQCVLHDLGSANGSFVNGARVTNQRLAPGDTLKFGSTSFRIE